jgi:hypothetical protein
MRSQSRKKASVKNFAISLPDFPAARAAAITLSSPSSRRSWCMCPTSVMFWTENVPNPRKRRVRTRRSVSRYVLRFPMWAYR